MIAKRRGFTVLDTLVALALTSVLLLVISGAGLAFMSAARDIEVSSSFQRDLVFAAEAIGNELRMATRFVPVSGVPMAYDVFGIDSTTMQEESIPTRVALSGNELRLGSRVLSKSMAELRIVPGETSAVCVLTLKTIGSTTAFRAIAPLAVDLDIHMRNHSIYYATTMLYSVVTDVVTTQSGKKCSISWKTVDAYGAPSPTYGQLYYRVMGTTDWKPLRQVPLGSMYNSGSMDMPEQNKTYQYLIRVFDTYNREVVRGTLTGRFDGK